MDCSSNCYGYQKFQMPGSKTCCVDYEYNGICYKKCPSKTRPSIENDKCIFFTCSYYYNYEQTDCLRNSTIPVGYYVNDTNSNTIDKCNTTCKTCNSKNNCTHDVLRGTRCLTAIAHHRSRLVASLGVIERDRYNA